MFYSYCRVCNNVIHWFLKPKYGFVICKLCCETNSYDDLCESQNNENHWKVLHRKNKIKKILNND